MFRLFQPFQESTVEITAKETLSVLMTSLYVAKWESEDDNPHVRELAGSPHLARLYNDVVDAMIGLDSARPDAVRNCIRSTQLWPSWSRQQKQQMVELLLSPFTATSATLEELLAL
jgi:hypothetical protein